jgi:4-amino-4-deoxy-L-arabinose transferase-like glycosyltransferase
MIARKLSMPLPTIRAREIPPTHVYTPCTMAHMTGVKNYSALALIILIMLGASGFLLYRLGAEPLQDYDEATYAEVVHEALADHNFLSFTYGGGDYFKKPPLIFWCMGASESLLGETTFAMRLPFVLSGIALIAILILLAYEVSGSLFTTALAGAIAATTDPLMETARQVRTDVPVTLCIMVAVYCFVRGLRDRRWFILFGAMAGLAVLAKSVIAVFAFVAAVAIIFFYQRYDLLKEKYLWYGIGMFILVAAPWHLYETLQYGWPFWQQYIGVEVLARTQMNIFWTVTITNGELIRYLEQFFEPWLWVLCSATVVFLFRWKSIARDRRAFICACLVTITCIGVVFFSASTKAPTYFMPLYPFAALVIALSIPPLSSRRTKIIGGCIAVFLVGCGAMGTFYNAYHLNPYYATTLALAVDEKNIGNILAQTPAGPWYVYDDENLGSIMFYSQHLHPLALLPQSSLAPGSLIVVDSNEQSTLVSNFPKLKTELVYGGSQVMLLKVD